ncbi:hypothetical protein EON80_15850 [bacterium]|nr:MAG: hypothetical protein EON80_15850 [bacterium]
MCACLARPIRAQPIVPSGYEALVAAGKLVLPGENGSPSTTEMDLTPAENLRRQRLAVARNAPALKLVRETLKSPIDATSNSLQTDLGTSSFGKIRELARQFRQESDVRAADEDWVGAVDSHLTIIEMGTAMTHGAAYIGMLVGVSVDSMALKNISPAAGHLDASASRRALQRLREIEESRPEFADITKVEKLVSLRLAAQTFGDRKLQEEWRKELADPETRRESGMTEAQAAEFLAMSPEQIEAEIASLFDAAIKRDTLSYARAKPVILPAAKALLESTAQILTNSRMRFNFERDVAAQRLFAGALELHAIKLETGKYPEKFEAPLDPFADDQRLVYKRKGDSYLLYSVGPDGRDNDGSAIQTIDTDNETGVKKISDRLMPESTGDIIAPVF